MTARSHSRSAKKRRRRRRLMVWKAAMRQSQRTGVDAALIVSRRRKT